MKKNMLFRSLLLISVVVLAFSCTKEELPEQGGSNALPPEAASKLIYSPENAVKGKLLVCFSEEATAAIEQRVVAVTRSGGIATRSGIDNFDAVLENIGVTALERLIPVDIRHEERMRAAGLHRWYKVDFDPQADLNAAARAMARIGEVSSVQFNARFEQIRMDGKMTPLKETPAAVTRAGAFNDPYLSKQWHYINDGTMRILSGSGRAKAGADVNVAEAWKLCTGDPRVVVAVIDNCVQWDHPDLAANMWVNADESEGETDNDGNGYAGDIHGWNFVRNTPLTISTGDGADHGTHVAGTVAAVNNNGIGVCGVAGGSGNGDGVRIMSCQIFNDNGDDVKDDGGDAATIAKAITYAANNGAVILQCSYGIPGGSLTSDEAYKVNYSAEQQAIEYFRSVQNCPAVDGGLVIFAAGNEQAPMSSYPAAYRNYISVTAMSCDFTPAYYTNFGPGCNIAAPGGDAYQTADESAMVLSTVLNGEYGWMQGTSMACPHVSGVAALGLSYALQQGKTFTREEFTSLLLTSANQIDSYCRGTKPFVVLGADGNPMQLELNLAELAGQMGAGCIDAFQVLMGVRGITCLPVTIGVQETLEVRKYIGGGNLQLTVRQVDISPEDRANLGIEAEPIIFHDKVILKCRKAGSAIVRMHLHVGQDSDSGMSGMNITKEFALVARASHPANGGWL